MTISYNLGFNPKWYIADMTGRPLGGGYMATFRSLNQTQQKIVYQDPAGTLPWPYVQIPNQDTTGILFDENGSQGPFYFEFDDMNTGELYKLEIYDSNGVLQWTINNYTGGTGGGGGTSTSVNDLQNLIPNNAFVYNIGTSTRPTPVDLILSPGNHIGLSAAYQDVRFQRTPATLADDQLIFRQFALGDTPFGDDPTPIYYIDYTCFNTFSGETYKYIQIPITKGVKNLENQIITISLWARGISGTQTITPYLFQFFGSGSVASPPVYTPIATYTLTSGWSNYSTTVAVPGIATKTLGQCGDDGLFLQLYFPLGVPCEIYLTKPAFYLGRLIPEADYETNDAVNALVNSHRTGDFSITLANFKFGGWVICNDGTIGNTGSNATTLASPDTFPLYELIWTNVSNANAPIFTSGGVATTRGASAVDDFQNLKRLALTKTLGRALASAGAPSSGGFYGSWALGQTFGEEVVTLNVTQIPSHTHDAGTYFTRIQGIGVAGGGGPAYPQYVVSPLPPSPHDYPLSGSSGATGAGAAHDNIQPTVHYNVFLKL